MITTLGFFRSMKREFNIIYCVEVDDKIVHKRAAMYESDLKCYRSWNKGHQAMLSDFFQETNDCTGGLATEFGPVKIDSISPAFMQICPNLVLLINSINGKMRQTMKGFSFSESGDFSPFSLHFKTSDITEIRDKYLKCVPSNFNMMELKEDEALTQIMVVFRIRIRMMQGTG